MITDRRLLLARPDLADARLEGRIEAARFARTRTRRVAVPALPLRDRPHSSGGVDTELLFGASVEVLDEAEGWSFLRAASDGYVGYAATCALDDEIGASTHRVSAAATHIHPETQPGRTSMKRPPMMRLTFGACVRAIGDPVPLEGASGDALPIMGGGYVYEAHLVPVDHAETDLAAVAARFIGVPYLWGGRSTDGLDCSGLVQIAAEACGLTCPRDADMQEGRVEGAAGFGAPVEDDPRRGDLVFWRGHVGIMLDPETLLHANAHHMAVAAEALTDVVARLEAAETPVTSLRRPPRP